MNWREVFGIAPDARPDFEHLHDLFRERINAAGTAPDEARRLATALEQARRELKPQSATATDDTVHNEQLLPP
jgi:hypothetical protein